MENGNGYNESLVFGEFNLDARLEILKRRGEEIHLAKRPFSVLLFLIENRERVVGRDELLNQFWDGHDVYDDALRKCVGAIRKALDDTNGSPRFIEIRRGSGYRFIGEVAAEKAVGSSSWQLAESSNGAKSFIDKGQRTNGERQIPQSANRNRSLLVAALTIVLISLAALGFFAYRRQRNDLAAKTLTETVATKRSIAILPLKNLTGDAANDYLSDGITESLINEVSRIETLKVISRGSAFQFKAKDVSAQEIGERLGVETILEGGYKQSGDQLRIEVRLVNAKDGSVMWASNFEQKKLADIFAIQDGITCQIVTELKVKLCGDVPPASRYTQNVAAYQAYLKGLYYRNRLGPEDLNKAVVYFNEALKIDSDYALAHEGLASVYAVMELNSQVEPQSVAPLAEQHALRALELDDNLAGAYVALGAVKTMQNYDLDERERYYREAIRRSPNHRTAHLWLANNLLARGKFEEAERELLAVREIDPLSTGMQLELWQLYYYWRKPDQSIQQAELMLAANPENLGVYSFLAGNYAQKNEFEKAFAAVEKNPTDLPGRAHILALAGRLDEARTIIEDFAASDGGEKNPYWVASLYAVAGDKETAFAWLEKSYAVRQADLVSIKIDPNLDSLHDDLRYADLLRRVHLADQ